MLCRALLTAIAISYLICVLVLSGMQKEDLDVNLLRKLQRYNLNIDDMNNQKLREECLSKANLVSKNNATERDERDQNNSTFKPITTNNNETKDSENEMNKIKEAVMLYIKNSVSTESPKIEVTQTDKLFLTIKTLDFPYHNIIPRSYATDYSNITSTTVSSAVKGGLEIEYQNGQPKLESVVKFWETFVKNNNMLTKKSYATTAFPKSVTVPEYPITQAQYSAPSVKYSDIITNSDVKEIESMKKLLPENYIFRKRTNPTQPPITNTPITTNFFDEMKSVHIKDQPKLESFVNFWYKYMKNNIENKTNLVTTEPSKIYNPTMQIVQPQTLSQHDNPNRKINTILQNEAKDLQDMSKFLSEYVYKQTFHTTQSPVTKAPIVNDMHKGLERMFNNGHPKLENVVKFWDMYMRRQMQDEMNDAITKMPKQVKQINTQYENPRNINTDIIDDGDAKNIQDMGKALTEFMYKNPTYITRPPVTQPPIKNDVYDWLEMEYNGHPKLESVVKFWTMYMRRKMENEMNVPTTDYPKPVSTFIEFNPTTMPMMETTTQNNLLNRHSENTNNINAKDIQEMSKLLTEYIYKNPVFATPSLGTGNPTFYRFPQTTVELMPQNRIPNIGFLTFDTENVASERENNNKKIMYSLDNVNFPQTNIDTKREEPEGRTGYSLDNVNFPQNNIQMKIEEPENRARLKDKMNENMNANRAFNNQIEYYVSSSISNIVHGLPLKNIENQYIEYQQKEYDKEILKKFGHIYSKPDSYKKNYKNSDMPVIKKFAPDIIRHIAETVKEIVLKDLRKAIITSTTATTTTQPTPDIMTTVPQKGEQNNIQQATQATQKFMELLERFKPMPGKEGMRSDDTTNAAPVSIRADNIPTYNAPIDIMPEKDEKAMKGYNIPQNMMFPPQMPPAVVAYEFDNQPGKMTPLVVNHCDSQGQGPNAPNALSPHKSNTINIITPLNRTPVININRVHPVPVMIQTSKEVPPLGVPISDPMLNLNIVLTTQIPYIINMNRNDRQRWDFMVKYGRSPETREEIKHRKDTLSEYSNDVPNKTEEQKKNVEIASRIGHRNLFRINNDYNEMNFNSQNDGHKKRIPEIRGFHHKLENVDDWPRDRWSNDDKDYLKVQVASRQQEPLSGMKKQSNFDDTHFKNFLKTQQKVNDMLERILATRTKPEGPRSVETT